MSNFIWITDFLDELWQGVQITLGLLVLAGFFGFLLATLVALMRLARSPLIAAPAQLFCSVLRGTPLLVQIYVLYYGVGTLFASYPGIRGSFLWPYLREGFWYVALALILSVGAYVGEVLRGGLRAVPKGELEAARAYGMRPFLVLRRIWLPRTLLMLKPTLAGESVMLLKSTALASTVAVTDLLGAANLVRSQTMITYEPLLLVAVIYILLAFLIERGFALFGKIPQRTA